MGCKAVDMCITLLLLIASATATLTLDSLFEAFDLNTNGQIDKDELWGALNAGLVSANTTIINDSEPLVEQCSNAEDWSSWEEWICKDWVFKTLLDPSCTFDMTGFGKVGMTLQDFCCETCSEVADWLVDTAACRSRMIVVAAELLAFETCDSIGGIATPMAGGLSIYRCRGCKYLSSLSNTQTIAGTNEHGFSIDIYANDVLVSLHGLEGVKTLDGGISIGSNTMLHDISGLQSVASVGYGRLSSACGDGSERLSIVVQHNPMLASLAGLHGLRGALQDVCIESNMKLRDLSALEGVTSLETLMIVGNPSLRQLNGLGYVSAIESITLKNNALLVDLSALHQITYVSGKVMIVSNTALTNLKGLHQMNQIKKGLVIRENCGLLTLDDLSHLEVIGSGGDIGFITVSGNSKLRSLGGLRNLRSVGFVDMDGASLESVEGFGRSLDFRPNSPLKNNFNLRIADSAPLCIPDFTSAEDSEPYPVWSKLEGVVMPDNDGDGVSMPDDLWDDGRCTDCEPPCEGDVLCDYAGFGMCICPLGTGGPACGELAEIWFDIGKMAEKHVSFDTGVMVETGIHRIMEPSSGERVDVLQVPLRRTHVQLAHILSAPPRAIHLTEYNEYAAQTMLQGRTEWANLTHGTLMIHFPVRRDRKRTKTEVVPLGMIIDPGYRYPDARVHNPTSISVYVELYGGDLSFTSASVSVSEGQDSSCMVSVQRTGGYGGPASVQVEVFDGGACKDRASSTIASARDDFKAKEGVLAVLHWADKEDDTKCVPLGLVDDADLEPDEAICLRLGGLSGSAVLLPSGAVSLVTIVDNEIPSDNSKSTLITLSAVLVSFSLLAFFAWHHYSKNRNQLAIQKAIAKSCAVTEGLAILESFSLESLPPSWHFLITCNTESLLCLAIVEQFLSAHKADAQLLADLRDEDGRIAMDVALPAFKKVMEKYILFCGRYKIDKGPVVHRSSTCEVVLASDHIGGVEDKDNQHQLIALKMMQNFIEFKCEIDLRVIHDLNSCVIPVLGWHVPQEGPEVPGFGEQPQHSPPGSKLPFILVLKRGDHSAFQSIVTQRSAGYDANAMAHLASQIAIKTEKLHAAGLIHCDLKLRNALVVEKEGQLGVFLCDLDASSRRGSVRTHRQKCGSSGYHAPEVASWLTAEKYATFFFKSSHSPLKLVCDTALDVWSFGMILYELCSGIHLFPQDVSNDAMVVSADELRLRLWNCISDIQLEAIFKRYIQCSNAQRMGAKHLIRWCLQGNPSQRPPMSEVVKHPFLLSHGTSLALLHSQQINSVGKLGSTFAEKKMLSKRHSTQRFIESTSSPEAKSIHRIPMRYHLFVSHMQVEASGDVGTLYHLFDSVGLHAWRDMNAMDLTTVGMRSGVESSDVFLLFLTNSVLSRPYVLMEISWALECGKPIVLTVEEEERFWCWDLTRWQADRCLKTKRGWEVGRLTSSYAKCPPKIRNLIESSAHNHKMLPYRRRDFEIEAFYREVCRRVSSLHVTWGRFLPPSSIEMSAAQVPAVTLRIIYNTNSHVALKMAGDFSQTIASVSPALRISYGEEGASVQTPYVLVLLTRGLLDKGTGHLQELKNRVCRRVKTKSVYFYFIYLENGEDQWEWGVRARLKTMDPMFAEPLTHCITGHEALKYRPREPAILFYEHEALATQIAALVSGAARGQKRSEERTSEALRGIPGTREVKSKVQASPFAMSKVQSSPFAISDEGSRDLPKVESRGFTKLAKKNKVVPEMLFRRVEVRNSPTNSPT